MIYIIKLGCFRQAFTIEVQLTFKIIGKRNKNK